MNRLIGSVAALVVAISANTTSFAADARSSAAASGKELFQNRCGVCHLQGGTGTFMLGRRLGQENALLEARKNLRADYVEAIVRNGLMSMPRFTRVELTDSELKQIATYLSSPKKPEPKKSEKVKR
jgi:mono/diheme cytochrome c family protein